MWTISDRFLHTIRWEDNGTVDLTRYAWSGGSSTVVTDVLGRKLDLDEHAGVLMFPAGVVVYAAEGSRVTSVVSVT